MRDLYLPRTRNSLSISSVNRIIKSISLLAIDPENLRGAVLKARSGPVREGLFQSFPKVFLGSNLRKLSPSVSDTELFGGIDFAATLHSGKPVKTRGILNEEKTIFLLSMSNLFDPALIGKLCPAIDNKRNLCFIASDESIDDEENSNSFLDRLAFFLTIDGLHFSYQKDFIFKQKKILNARKNLYKIQIKKEVINTFVMLSTQLGIISLRAPMMACYAARAAAAYAKSPEIQNEHICDAADLVLSHRATILPTDDKHEEKSEEPSKKMDAGNDNNGKPKEKILPIEIILDAIKSNLSPEVLKTLSDKRKLKSKLHFSSGYGQKKQSNRRGRPIPSKGEPFNSKVRIDIVETLKTAAPWQTIRRANIPKDQFRLFIRASDIKIKKYEEKSDRLIIFAVDASGTTALGRLGETKGAIETLLSEAYARRDHVALISFREKKASIELPPTRSLVQTKRHLASLPGGGTTPLAGALDECYKVAMNARSKGMTPTLALLTDGKGNIALDGTSDREKAMEDLEKMAQVVKSGEIPTLVIDTSNRPQLPAKSLSQKLNATYIPLPYADSKRLYSAISSAIK